MSPPELPDLTPHECFALLDDCDSTAADPRSRLYTGLAGILACEDAAGLPRLLDDMQRALLQGRHALALFSYELGADLHEIKPRAGHPAWAQILLFENCARLSAEQVTAWLSAAEGATDDNSIATFEQRAGIGRLQASVDSAQFHQAVARIHDYLEAGDTYQVNYTYRLRFDAYGSLRALYRNVRARQPVPYGALIALPDGRAVLSLSPELFVRHRRGRITAQPMKGTAAASGDARQDAARAAALAADPKNRAENLMIVDLLRNDLGKIAALGTVQVPHLFDVAAYGSVLQMTSTVSAQLRRKLSLTDLLTALYPCGSITGAPKRRTMQIIRELEPDARGIYTGAIGWFDAPGQGQDIGDFCLSVPIRTLALQAPAGGGLRVGEMGVGAGITHDSDAADEYAECQLKAQFLSGLANDFELFETMHATRAGGCRHIDLHLRRLSASAAYFGFACDESNLRDSLRRACAGLPAAGSHRMRLALNQAGVVKVQSAPLTPLPATVRVSLSPQRTEAGDLFLRHKSTLRQRYDAAWRAAESQGGFDMLFCNTNDELTEGARSNVFIKLEGRWYTPPLSAGVLPGVMRSVLLADPAWNARERTLTLDDLRQAEEIVVCNSLRGALPATLDWESGNAAHPPAT